MSIFKSEFIDIDELLRILKSVQKQTLKLFGEKPEVQLKADQSPITTADLINHDSLSKYLPKLLRRPVFSEENYPPFDERRTQSEYWLIDPIDGTKEFIHHLPDFSVLIALMKNNRPHLSVILVPANDEVYLAEQSKGAFVRKGGHWHALTANTSVPSLGLVSRFHPEPEVETFYLNNSITDRWPLGSALKFCAIATGSAAIYFRHKGPHEWDVAAGDLLVQEAGAQIFCWPERQPLQYNAEGTRVRPFVAAHASLAQTLTEVNE